MTQKQRFSLRKYKLGLASVMLGAFFVSTAVSANDVQVDSVTEEATAVVTSSESSDSTGKVSTSGIDMTKEFWTPEGFLKGQKDNPDHVPYKHELKDRLWNANDLLKPNYLEKPVDTTKDLWTPNGLTKGNENNAPHKSPEARQESDRLWTPGKLTTENQHKPRAPFVFKPESIPAPKDQTPDLTKRLWQAGGILEGYGKNKPHKSPEARQESDRLWTPGKLANRKFPKYEPIDYTKRFWQPGKYGTASNGSNDKRSELNGRDDAKRLWTPGKLTTENQHKPRAPFVFKPESTPAPKLDMSRKLWKPGTYGTQGNKDHDKRSELKGRDDSKRLWTPGKLTTENQYKPRDPFVFKPESTPAPKLDMSRKLWKPGTYGTQGNKDHDKRSELKGRDDSKRLWTPGKLTTEHQYEPREPFYYPPFPDMSRRFWQAGTYDEANNDEFDKHKPQSRRNESDRLWTPGKLTTENQYKPREPFYYFEKPDPSKRLWEPGTYDEGDNVDFAPHKPWTGRNESTRLWGPTKLGERLSSRNSISND
ncbi:YSIRK-type signal peptide-containing protein [Streptococcus hongkongensis]